MRRYKMGNEQNLPVKLLTELISPEEIIVAEHVRETHRVQYCPIGVSLPEESDVALKYYCGAEQFSEFRYTPRAYFAVKVWETAKDDLLKRPEFAGALDIEWYPVAATFRSIRFANGGTERFIAAMFDEMRRIADSRMVDIRYGRFDMPALPSLPDYPRRYYIMPGKLLIEKRGYGMKDELNSLQNIPAGTFSWGDIEDAFVVLKPIQLAYIAGDEMNNHTPLDEEFICACGDFDIGKVKELVAKGANIHAAGQYGDTAMDTMMLCYYDFAEADENGCWHFDDKNRDNFIELAQYLLSLGYNINISGYAESTCLDHAPHIEDLEIVKFLLTHGANPNLGSFIGDYPSCWILGRTVLAHTWDDLACESNSWQEKLSTFLLRHGALPVPEGEPLPDGELKKLSEAWKAKGQWDDSLVVGLSDADAALIHCAKHIFFYQIALIAQNGGNADVRDPRGRNLLQIMLEDAGPTESNPKYFQVNLAEMALMLLCGLKLKLSDAEIERAKEICRSKGYTEALDAISSVVCS